VSRDVRKDPPLKVSAKTIEAKRSKLGGWTAEQLAAWGVPWPPPTGWRKALERGERIPD
jgi:hypothetical protein